MRLSMLQRLPYTPTATATPLIHTTTTRLRALVVAAAAAARPVPGPDIAWEHLARLITTAPTISYAQVESARILEAGFTAEITEENSVVNFQSKFFWSDLFLSVCLRFQASTYPSEFKYGNHLAIHHSLYVVYFGRKSENAFLKRFVTRRP